MLPVMYNVSVEHTAKDCDGPLYQKPKRVDMPEKELAELLGDLVMQHTTIEITRDGGETWVTAHANTEDGYQRTEVWFAEMGEGALE